MFSCICMIFLWKTYNKFMKVQDIAFTWNPVLFFYDKILITHCTQLT